MAAAQDLRSPSARALDEALDALEVVGVDHRRDRRRVVARVAEHVLVGGRVEALQERVADRLLDEQARAGEADLARRRRTGRPPCAAAASRSASANTRNGFLPPSSAVNGTMFCGRAPPMWRPSRRAGERDAPQQRVRDERGAGLLADPLHDVEDAGRQPGLDGQVGEQRARERRPLGRLEDDRCSPRRAPAPSSTSRA